MFSFLKNNTELGFYRDTFICKQATGNSELSIVISAKFEEACLGIMNIIQFV